MLYRLAGLLALGICFLVQSAYEYFFCGGGLLGFWRITAIVLIPPALFILWPNPAAAPAAALTVLLFCLWANSMECVPYTGGGAAMAYVLVFVYGWPASIFVGVLAGMSWRSRQSLKQQANAA
jgi:hypothetical protein